MKTKNVLLRTLMVLAVLLLCAIKASAQTKETYAFWNSTTNVLTFYYDDKRSSRTMGETYNCPFTTNAAGWYDKRDIIKEVVFDSSFNDARINSTFRFFWEMSELVSISGLQYLNTSEVTDMSYMFCGCSKLQSLDVSRFNTSKVTDMQCLFRNCSSLQTLDVSNFDTHNVTDMGCMFEGCSNVQTLDVSNFDTRKVKGMSRMFEKCGVRRLNLSKFNTANIEATNSMFEECPALTSLDLSSFNTSKVTNMERMFANSANLHTIYVSDDWTTAVVNYSKEMFLGCESLEGCNGTQYSSANNGLEYARYDNPPSSPGYLSPGISVYAVYNPSDKTLAFYYDYEYLIRPGTSYRLNKISAMPGWYEYRSSINHVVFNSTFDTVRPTQMNSWFDGMSNLQDITGFEYLHTDDVTNMRNLFSDCKRLTSLNLGNFKTSNVEDMRGMFQGCSNLKTIYISNSWNTDNVTISSDMFTGCTSLQGSNGTVYDTNHTNKEYARYDNPPSSPGYMSPYVLQYGLTISGIAVTEQNASNITGDAITSGTVSFNPQTHTLTLNNATINNKDVGIRVLSDYIFNDLTISLVGENTIRSYGYRAIMLPFNTTITGTGTLSGESLYVFSGKTLTIDGGCSMSFISFEGDGKAEKLVVKGANTFVHLSATHTRNITDFASVTLEDGLIFSKPVNGYYDTTQKCVMDGDGNKATDVTISNTCEYGLMVAGIAVTNNNAEDITGDGTVQFDAATHTLTLNNATISSSTAAGIATSDNYAFSDLAIKLVGSNRINLTGSWIPVVLICDATITGTGTLTSTGLIKVYDGKTLTIGGGSTVKLGRLEGTDQTEKLVLRNAQTCLEVTTNIYKFSSLTLYDGLNISMPVGGYYDTTNKYIVNSSGSQTTHVIINNNTDHDYGVSVAGVAVKASNASDVLGDGAVSYNPDTHTLTLTDANIESSTAPGILLASNYAFDNLIINLVGDNTMTISAYQSVVLRFLTTITGTGSLTLKNAGSITMYDGKHLNIEGGCTINCYAIQATNSSGTETLTVRGENTQLNMSFGFFGFASVTLEDGLYYTKPLGGSYDTSIRYVVDSDGNKWTKGVIVKNPPYVVFNSANTTLTFYRDGQRASHNEETEKVYDLNEGEDYPEWYEDGTFEEVTKVVFHPSFAGVRPKSTSCWFAEMYDLTTITGIEHLNTVDVTNMSGMFNYCSSLTDIDVSGFSTKNVTDMSYMFSGCRNLTSLDVRGFNTSNVTTIAGLFGSCERVTELDISNFDTRKVTSMNGLFYYCSGLTTIDLSGFDTGNVTDFSYMFCGCSGLTSLDLNGFDTSKATDMRLMFTSCSNLANLNVTGFDTHNVETMYKMFSDCTGLKVLDLSSFNTSALENTNNMFENSSNLKTIYVADGWTMENVSYSNKMFNGCTSLVGGMGTRYDANHVNKAYAHIDGGASNPGYLTKVGAYLYGDVNGDGQVGIGDIVAITNVMAGTEKDPAIMARADVNGDTEVGIGDIVAITNIMAGM